MSRYNYPTRSLVFFSYLIGIFILYSIFVSIMYILACFVFWNLIELSTIIIRGIIALGILLSLLGAISICAESR